MLTLLSKVVLDILNRNETDFQFSDKQGASEALFENKLNVPLPRTNCYKNSFSYSGAILWNSLPCDFIKGSRVHEAIFIPTQRRCFVKSSFFYLIISIILDIGN